MRRTITLLAASIVMLAAAPGAHAQSDIYSVKFICGTQSPAGLTAPSEPPVKPGNYATTIDIEGIAEGTKVIVTASLPGAGSTIKVLNLGLSQYTTEDVFCRTIQQALSAAGITPASFITGYVNILASSPLAVTGVYTSQPCTFVPGIRPLCAGPTHIDVEPQQPSLVPPPPTAG